ncbi:MAG: cytochrome D1 domain-containing protein, partial [Candidatus Poseidoniaceae archaeon]|nr:cytochrome D1 domain-containing protein [Candidatus Poseidoniaceae archaeon]
MYRLNVLKRAKIALLITALLVGTTLSGCIGSDDAISCGQGTVLKEDECVLEESGTDESGEWVVFNIESNQWSFEPNEIIVDEGDKVRLIFTSTSDEQSQYNLHSFGLNAYDIAVDLPVGETVTVEFEADLVGEFPFDCSIFCGDRHNDMTGVLIVNSAGNTEVIAEPETGNNTALVISTDIYDTTTSPNGIPQWNNSDLMLIIEREAERIAFVDTTTDEIVGRISGLGFQPHTAVFDEDSEYGYLISRGGWLSKIQLDDLTVPNYVKVGVSSRGTALSSDGNWVIATNYEPSSFMIVNTSTMEIAMEYQLPIRWENGESQFSRAAAALDTANGYIFVAMKDLGEIWVIDSLEHRWGDSPFPVVKIFHEQGGMLHDAFITPDSQYYILASQTSHHMSIIDAKNLTEVGLVEVGLKPHPGPGAVWGKYIFTPSIGEGKLNIINSETWENEFALPIGGPALFTRTFEFGDPSSDVEWEKNHSNLQYPYVWWDTVLSSDVEQNKEVYVLDASKLYLSNASNESIASSVWTLKDDDCEGRTLHPEFSHDGSKVYVSCWAEAGYLLIY